MRRLAALMALIATPAAAGDLAVSLKTPSGKPVADAVVMIAPAGPRRAVKIGGPYRMAQKDMQFSPFVLVAPVGAEVAFPNLDPVRHHVYSFSAAKPFELKLYGRDETRRVTFDRPGVVAVGCNIHDSMSAFIRVVDTPYAAKTSASGEAVLPDVPPGPVTVTIWHPYLKAPRNELVRPVAMTSAGVSRLALAVDLRVPPMRHGAY